MTTTTKTVLAALLASALTACTGGKSVDRPNLRVTASRAQMSDVFYMVLDVQPGNVQTELSYDARSNSFTGEVIAPPGAQTLTLKALGEDKDLDGELDVLGVGSSQVNVVTDKIAAVYIEVVDSTPPPPVPDHAPVITSFWISNSSPAALEASTVQVNAVDPDGDEISYDWSFSCPADFLADSATSGHFIALQTGNCSVTVTASANGLTDVLTFDLVVQDAFASVGTDGSVVIDVGFVTAPYVSYAWVLGDGYSCALDRAGANATCAQDANQSSAYDVWVAVSSLPAGATIDLADDCGGTIELLSPGAVQAYRWTSPAASGLCMLTGSVSWNGGSDAFPVALFVQ